VRLISLILTLCAVAPGLLAEDQASGPGGPEGMAVDGGDAGFSDPGSDPGRILLPPLQPLEPGPREARLPGLDLQGPGDGSEGTLPLPAESDRSDEPLRVELAPRALEIPAAWDQRLHADLPWEYCGPKPGAAGIGGVPTPMNADGVPVRILADRVDYDRNADVIELRGGIEVTQAEQRLEAERSTYDRRSGQLDASGHVYLDSSGLRIQGDRAKYNLFTKRGKIEGARYRLSGSANLLGTAEEAEILSDRQSRYRNITYTTCPPGNADWSIKARDLKLDQETGLGQAWHARIRVGKIPVLYSPYLFFPIDDRRRSGFLIPSFGSSNTTGTDISIPYYWNIAPNMDATLTPRYMSTRGLMLGAQVRHLTRFQELEINGEVLPEDRRATEEGLRGALRIQQAGRLGARWSSSVDFASVSDDTYLQDFGNRLDVTSLRNLVQRAQVNYAGEGWRLLTRVQQFQTIDTTIPSARRPYAQMPHLELAVLPQRWQDLIEYGLDGQYDFFDHPTKVHGNRLVAVPSLRMPFRRGFGYLTPRARLYSIQYDLTNQTEGLPERESYLIPSFDLDGTLFFERDTQWLGTPALQTLEPRLYYVLTSFEDQSDAPLFDTTALDFSFASLFRPNRFTGFDRIGDENRLTVGLTSRTIANGTGGELFRASIGQIYFFEDRRVQLLGQPVEEETRSSVAGELAAQLTENWSARASAQWNPNKTEQPWEKRVLQLRYAADDGRRVNLAYRFNYAQQSALRYEDTDLSFQMPVGPRVRLVGRWLYSMLNDETLEAFAGIEFGRCCWRLRLLGQHLQTGDDGGNTSVMLQVELAGLGSFGNQIDKVLERGIYGYHTD